MSRGLRDDERPILLKEAGGEKYSFEFLKKEVYAGRLEAFRLGNKLFTHPSNMRDFEAKTTPTWWKEHHKDGPGIYVIGFADYVKIGWSTDIRSRIETLQLGVPLPLKVYGIISADRRTEPTLHRRFTAYRLRGEWFRYEGELKDWADELEKQEIRPQPQRWDRL